MVTFFKWSAIAISGFVVLAFLPNVLSDRQDKQVVKDATATTLKTGVGLVGGAWSSLKEQWIANHQPTVLPEEKVANAAPAVIVINSGENKEISVTQQD
jgi:hypothetical protein